MPRSGAACAAQRCIAAAQRAMKFWRALRRSRRRSAGSSCCSGAASAAATAAMLRGSVWMCGLPAACTSPSARSSCVGTSSFRTYCAASKLPGLPGCTLALPDCCSSIGSQPISSSAPVQTTRSALRSARDQARPRLDLVRVLQRRRGDERRRPCRRRVPWPARPIRARRRTPRAPRAARLGAAERRQSSRPRTAEHQADHGRLLRRSGRRARRG